MANKVALVTGADKSIGLEAVRGLAQLGYTVYLTSRNEKAGQLAARQLSEAGDVRYLRLDVRDEANIIAVLEAIGAEHGRLDALVNNAAIALKPIDIVNVEAADIELTLATNLHGPVRLTQLAVPLLRASGAGRVVMVSSGAGSSEYLADPTRPNPYAYCLSKAGLNAATMMFAEAVRADGIKVNAVTPGYVNSAISFFRGTRTAAHGAEILIKFATLPDDGPTGGFFYDDGVMAW